MENDSPSERIVEKKQSWYFRWHNHLKHPWLHWLILMGVSALLVVGINYFLNNAGWTGGLINAGAKVQVDRLEMADDQGLRQQVLGSTSQLHDALKEYNQLPPNERQDALEKLKNLANERHQLLINALGDETDAIIEYAVEAEAKKAFPAEVQPWLEEEVILEGEYNLAIGDDFEGKKAKYHHELHRPKEKPVKLQVGKKLPTVKPGTNVSVHGIKIGDEVAVKYMIESGEPRVTTSQVQGITDWLGSDAEAQTSPAVPAFSSLPGAAQTIYLDFNGHFEPQWGSWFNVTTPVFSMDGDTTTYNNSEIELIERIWQLVAEDYSPFEINVTTVEPASFANGAALRVAIGGSSYDWFGDNAGGVCYVNSFTSSIANVCYVFSVQMLNNSRYIGEGASHESGHGFGLMHQSSYNSSGAKIEEYYSGPGDGTAPIMGYSYYVTRGLWWYGTSSNCATCYQDDLTGLASLQNIFGYRADDHGNEASGATPLTAVGEEIKADGIINSLLDRDYFSINLESGMATFWANGPAYTGNLDVKIEVRDSQDVVIAASDPADSLGAIVNANITVPGTYLIVVLPHGLYGDLGQYTLKKVLPPTPSMTPTLTPSATPSSTPAPTPTPTLTPTPTPTPMPTPSPTPIPPDETPPQVTISSPANGAVLKKNVNFVASASDGSGIKSLTLAIDGVVKKTCTATSCSYTIKPSSLKQGGHTLKATAVDNAPAANTGSASIQVTR